MENEKKVNPQVIIVALVALLLAGGLYFSFIKEKEANKAEAVKKEVTMTLVPELQTEKVYTVAQIYTEGANSGIRKIIELSKNCQVVEINTDEGILKLIDIKAECLEPLIPEPKDCPICEQDN